VGQEEAAPTRLSRLLRFLSGSLLVLFGAGCGPGTPRFEPTIEPLLGTIWAEVILHPGDPAGQRLLRSGYLHCPALDPASDRVAVRLITDVPAVPATLPEGSFTPTWAIHIVPPDASLPAPVWSGASYWQPTPANDLYWAQLLYAPGAGQPWAAVGAPQWVALSQGMYPRIDFDRPGLWTVVQIPGAAPPSPPP
jgi:hypothetical protein